MVVIYWSVILGESVNCWCWCMNSVGTGWFGYIVISTLLSFSGFGVMMAYVIRGWACVATIVMAKGRPVLYILAWQSMRYVVPGKYKLRLVCLLKCSKKFSLFLLRSRIWTALCDQNEFCHGFHCIRWFNKRYKNSFKMESIFSHLTSSKQKWALG